MRKILVVFLLVAAGLVLPAQVVAQNAATANPSTTSATREQRLSELRDKTGEARCSIIQKNIQAMVQRYDTAYAKQLSAYRRVIANLNAIIERLNGLGQDVSTLQQAKAQLELLITEMEGKFTDLVAKVNEAKGESCVEGGKTYREIVQAATLLLRDLRSSSTAIRDYILENIKAEVNKLK
ncbi:MAG: hypothetical protein JNK26_04415 [Candidatus Doudnabacteria bacterium]|nr:hypothetical protein [Candidatus Doudnabacteria bacterium]